MDENNNSLDSLEGKIDETIQQVSSPLSDYISGPLLKLVTVVIIIIAGLILLKILMHIIGKALDHSRLDDVLHTFIKGIVKTVFMVLLVLTVLGYLGIPMTPFITMLGACGAAVALALKDSLGNFAGGVLIMLNQPFKKGDFIECSGVTGRVQEINLLYSTLTTPNRVISMPNGILANQTLVNFSENEYRRVDCHFSVSYDSDINKAKDILCNVIERSEFFRSGRNYSVGVSEHADSAIIIDALAWCKNDDYYAAKYYLLEEVKREFDEAGIEIPFPQITVHNAVKQKGNE
jgi:small conductance mechanosensitive channel